MNHPRLLQVAPKTVDIECNEAGSGVHGEKEQKGLSSVGEGGATLHYLVEGLLESSQSMMNHVFEGA